MSLKDITITGSIGSKATQSYGQRTYISSTDEQSFPIEHITGSYAGSWPDFKSRSLTSTNSASNTTVNLIVNVTQSWPASNTTPLGIVPYVHNTMEEFIDGEFSGSNYTVSNGNLNDAQCEQFLTVGTTPTSYSMFPYATAYTDGTLAGGTSASLDLFLDKRTIPANGQFLMHYNVDTITDVPPSYTLREIDYIKVARIDQEGTDNTLSLQELTQFIWTDSTAGIINLTILDITEYPTYYLYKVKSIVWKDLIYYADDNVLNYAFSASSAGSMTATANLFYLNNWNVINNATGQWGGVYYKFALTPNCKITYTSSINVTNPNGSSVNFNFGFWGSSDFNTFTPIQTSSLITLGASATTTVTLSGSTFTQFFGQTNYWLETKNNTLPLTITNASWVMTQSAVPQLYTSSVVIEPYLLSTFTNSDCDVLMNNASQNDYSNFYRAVLYENGGTIPSNLQQIISGTAEYAQVNDYLYNANANVLPRYKGVRRTSQNFNLPSTNGFTNEELANLPYPSSLIINNGTPNVEQTTTYFAYFNNLKANWPIFKNTTSPVLKYIIKEDGTVYTPSTDDIVYWNTVDSFERGKQAYTSLLNNTTVVFNSTSSILLSGESYTPILYSISASNASIATFVDATSNTLNFDNLQGTLAATATPVSYSLYLQKLNQGVSLADGATHNVFYYGINSTNFNDPGQGHWQPNYGSANVYEPYYSFDNIPNTKVKVLFQLDSFTPGFINSNTLIMEIWKKNGGTSTSIGQKIINLPGIGTRTVFIGGWGSGTTTQQYAQTWDVSSTANCIAEFVPSIGDTMYCTAKVVTPASGSSVGNFSLKITTLGLNIPGVSGPFWFTGSANSNILTSSVSLAQVMDGNYKQLDIGGSGFDPIESPCVPKIGDEIRFEYDESNTYRIINTDLISGSGEFVITLDGNVPSISTLNINHFTIRRKIKDYITGIALDANLILPIQEGFLFPEYPSFTLKENFPNIVNDLYGKTLI
jgi:hypothetical protein